MSFQESQNLTTVINARGTFTPLGVSRSSRVVCEAVTEALSNYFIIHELQDIASKKISKLANSESAAVTHCTASGITVSIAAAMTGMSQERIESLPNTEGMADCVIIPSSHCVNYGHSILQAIRISGALPVIAGNKNSCSLEDIEQQIVRSNTCCLLLVSSKLVGCEDLDFSAAVKLAHKYGIPAIIDGAAQDFRIKELIQTEADLVLISAQKYLAAPTAGLVVGKKQLVDAVKAQEKGIGRGMKATKEALIGVLAAVQERESLNLEEWKKSQQIKIDYFVENSSSLNGICASEEVDITGLPFSRVNLKIDSSITRVNAKEIADKLSSGKPAIWVIEQKSGIGELGFELVQTTKLELDIILKRLAELTT